MAPYSSNFLSSVLKPGTPRELVLNTFGTPLDESNAGVSRRCLTYSSLIAGRDLPDENHYVGFQVILSNDVVVGWVPVLTAEAPRGSFRPEPVDRERVAGLPAAASLSQSNALSLFVVSDTAPLRGRYVDTERFPKLGYVRETPDLSVKSVVSVTRRRSESGQPLVVIELTSKDAATLQQFTAANVHRRMLVMLGEQPIAAPYILVPIDTGSLVIQCRNQEEVNAVYRVLSRRVQR
jgi:hypothetical protein